MSILDEDRLSEEKKAQSNINKNPNVNASLSRSTPKYGFDTPSRTVRSSIRNVNNYNVAPIAPEEKNLETPSPSSISTFKPDTHSFSSPNINETRNRQDELNLQALDMHNAVYHQQNEIPKTKDDDNARILNAPSESPYREIGIPRPKRTTFQEFLKNFGMRNFPVEFDHIITPFTDNIDKLRQEVYKPDSKIYIAEYNAMFGDQGLYKYEKDEIKDKVKEICKNPQEVVSTIRELNKWKANDMHEFAKIRYEIEMHLKYSKKTLKKHDPDVYDLLYCMSQKAIYFADNARSVHNVIGGGIASNKLKGVEIDTK